MQEMFGIGSQNVPVPEILRRAIHFGMPKAPEDTKAPFAPEDLSLWMPAANLSRHDPEQEREEQGKDSDKHIKKVVDLIGEIRTKAINIGMGETWFLRDIIQKVKDEDNNAAADVQRRLDELRAALQLLESASYNNLTPSPWHSILDGVRHLESQLIRVWKHRVYWSKALEAILDCLQEDLGTYAKLLSEQPTNGQ